MKGRNASGLMFPVLLLLLATGPGPVGGAQPTKPVAKADANASSVADAPWFKVEVDTAEDTGQHVSVAIDPVQGGVYVSYYDAKARHLRMAHYHHDLGPAGNCGPADSWYCQTVDSGGDIGKYSSIAAMAGGVNISYHDAVNGDLKWAESTDSPYHQSWRIRTVDRGVFPAKTGLYTSLSLPSYGSPRISYHFQDPNGDDALKLARYIGGGGNCGYGEHAGKWQCDIIETGEGVGEYTSLALDDDWHRHIAYYHAANGELWYATNKGGTNCGPGGNTWTCIPVTGGTADVGRYASLYVDSANRFHIAYYDATNKVLKYAVNVGGGGNCGVLGSALCEDIDSMPANYHPLGVSIAEDAAGYPIIAYQGEYNSLKLARPVDALGLPPGAGNCGPAAGLFRTWFCETIDHPNPFLPYHRNADYASIDINPSGLATVAYYGFITASGGNLQVASQRFQVSLDVFPAGMGSGIVTGNGLDCAWNGSSSGTCSVNLAENTAVILTASPSIGSTFAGWVNGSGSASSCSGTGNCAFTITAPSGVGLNFPLQQAGYYQLAVSPSGTGNGTVTGNGINCVWNGTSSSGTCSVNLAENTAVILTASSSSGSIFAGWVNGSGSASSCSGTDTCSFTITEPSEAGSNFISGVYIYLPLILRN